MSLRQSFTDSMKEYMKAGDSESLSTIRMVIAELKKRDIDARGSGNMDGISDGDILSLLQGMIKQRRESITMYQQGGRQDLADKESGEIKVIERFLPQQLSNDEIQVLVGKIIGDVGAVSAKDMGKVMAVLKEKYAGQLDMTQASAIAKQKLA